MPKPRKAIIIGAGPAGLAAALRLHQSNIETIIYEIRTEPSTLGGAIGLSANGTRLLDRLGVLEAVMARGSSRTDISIHSLYRGELGTIEDFAARGRTKTGYGYVRVQRPDLIGVLLGAAQKVGTTIKWGAKITEIEDSSNQIEVKFQDGTADSADLLLGCDGIHSSVRRLYVDPSVEPQYTGIATLLSVIPTTHLSEAVTSHLRGLNATLTRHGVFMTMPASAAADAVYWGFSREVAVPPADEGSEGSLGSWQDSRDGWELRGKQEVQSFRQKLLDILNEGPKEGWNQALHELLDATPVMKFYPIYRLPQGKGGAWCRGRCLLLGDAAHAMPPHAGQGVGMALEDVFVIARTLAACPGGSVREAFSSFERIRRPRIQEVGAVAERHLGIRKDMDEEEDIKREEHLRKALAETDGLAVADQFFAQTLALYNVEQEMI